VIWVQFLAPDLTALPILDCYVRWRVGERRIGVGDGSKIQIRPILIREQALVRPRGPTKGLLIELETRILLVKGRLRQNQPSAELTRLNVSLSTRRGSTPGPRDWVDSVKNSDVRMPKFSTGCCPSAPGDQSEMSQSTVDVPMTDRKGCTCNRPLLLTQGVGSPEGGVGKSARKSNGVAIWFATRTSNRKRWKSNLFR
jgi:hypothetical protein